MKVLLAGGGTAGHTSPLLATAAALMKYDASIEILCLGTSRGLETTVIPEAGYRLELVPPVPLPRRPGLDLLRLPGRLRAAVKAAVAVIDEFRPDVVVGYGGYVSVPAYLAARRRKVPVVVHEQNALPGVANKLGARIAARRGGRVAVSFPDTQLGRRPQYVGLPLRAMIATLDRSSLRMGARTFFGLSPERPTLVVTGGSQGARRINEAVLEAAPALSDAGIQVLHAVGAKNAEGFVAPTTKLPYVVVPYVERMDYALAAADLLIGRAGASSVIEAAASGVPAVFVPLPIGNGEQALNAAPVVAAGGAILVDDAAFTADWIRETIPSLITDTARLARMGAAATALVPRDAADALARIILGVAAGRGEDKA